MTYSKYERLKEELNTVGTGKMRAFGNSMLPLIKSGSLLTFQKCNEYEVGDIVFCKIRKFIDAHLITKKDQNKGYLIANNKGYENGWTRLVSLNVALHEADVLIQIVMVTVKLGLIKK